MYRNITGNVLHYWGTKAPGGDAQFVGYWHDWQRHFDYGDNTVMQVFMRQAIRDTAMSA